MFYLFEPLYHVQLALLPRLTQNRNLADRRVMLGAARDLLRSLYHCRLNSLENYIRPHPSNHSTDKLFRRGASKGYMHEHWPTLYSFDEHNHIQAWNCFTIYLWNCLSLMSVLQFPLPGMPCLPLRPVPVHSSSLWGISGPRWAKCGVGWWRGMCQEVWATKYFSCCWSL